MTQPVFAFIHGQSRPKVRQSPHLFRCTRSLNRVLRRQDRIKHQRQFINDGQLFFLLTRHKTSKRHDAVNLRHGRQTVRQRIRFRQPVGQNLNDVGRRVRVGQ